MVWVKPEYAQGREKPDTAGLILKKAVLSSLVFEILILLHIAYGENMPHVLSATNEGRSILAPCDVDMVRGMTNVDLGSGIRVVGGEVPGDNVLQVPKSRRGSYVVQSLITQWDIFLKMSSRRPIALVSRHPAYRFFPIILSSGDNYVLKHAGNGNIRLVTRSGSDWRVYVSGSGDHTYLNFDAIGYLTKIVLNGQETTLNYDTRRTGKILREVRDPHGNVTTLEFRDGSIFVGQGTTQLQYILDRDNRITSVINLTRDYVPLLSLQYAPFTSTRGGYLRRVIDERTKQGFAYEYPSCLSLTRPCSDLSPISCKPMVENNQNGETIAYDYRFASGNTLQAGFSTASGYEAYQFERFDRNTQLRVTQISDGYETTRWVYSGNHYLPQMMEKSYSGGSTFVTTYENDLTLGLPTKRVFGNSNTQETYFYNAFGQPLSITDLHGIVMAFTYNSAGQLSSERRGGHSSLWTYDSNHCLESYTRDGVLMVRFTNNTNCNVLSYTDSFGGVTRYGYATGPNGYIGRQTSITLPDGTNTSWTFLADGPRLTTNGRTSFPGGGTQHEFSSDSHSVLLGSSMTESWGEQVNASVGFSNGASRQSRTITPGNNNTWVTHQVAPSGSNDTCETVTLNGAVVKEQCSRVRDRTPVSIPH